MIEVLCRITVSQLSL